MKNTRAIQNSVVFYSEGQSKDVAICCICGEKTPERKYRGLGVCSHCLEYIRTND